MTSPEKVLKYCAKCGDSRFVFDGDRSFKCTSCGFHLYINSSSAVAGIITNSQGEVLLTVRAFDPYKGCLDLPGGFVDPMETAEEALVREVKEELNLDVTKLTYLTSSANEYVFGGLSVYTTDLCFVCELSDLDNVQVADDVSAYQFVAPNAIEYDLIGGESIKSLLRKYVERYNE